MLYQLVVVGLCLLGVWLLLRDGAGEEGGVEVVQLNREGRRAGRGGSGCHLHSHHCYDVYRCGGAARLTVYVYPDTEFRDIEGEVVFPLSAQYSEMLEAVRGSEYNTPDPHQAQ